MNQIIHPDDNIGGLKTIGHISYLLHAIVAFAAVMPGMQASVALLIIAFVLDLVKKPDATGTWHESHFKWRISTVLWAAVLYTVTSPLFLLLYVPGWIAWGIISIWFFYRIVKGWVNMNSNKPMPL